MTAHFNCHSSPRRGSPSHLDRLAITNHLYRPLNKCPNSRCRRLNRAVYALKNHTASPARSRSHRFSPSSPNEEGVGVRSQPFAKLRALSSASVTSKTTSSPPPNWRWGFPPPDGSGCSSGNTRAPPNPSPGTPRQISPKTVPVHGHPKRSLTAYVRESSNDKSHPHNQLQRTRHAFTPPASISPICSWSLLTLFDFFSLQKNDACDFAQRRD
jgi:hypothetical protein